MRYHERSNCRFCGSTDLVLYLDLGAQPPSNSFLCVNQVSQEEKFPLKVYLCRQCSLSQLLGIVSAEEIFDEYQYLSSTSKALVRHYQSLVAEVLTRFKLPKHANVLDIGCNDGIILDPYLSADMKTLGVEPSSVQSIAREKGHTVFGEFFNENLAKKIKYLHGPVSIITATNVFAHIDDIHTVLKGVFNLLSPQGIFIIETPYVIDMIEQVYFDTIYHEHLGYLGLTALSHLFDNHGLEIFDVTRISLGASGPAIRVFSKKKAANKNSITDGQMKTKKVMDMLAEEKEWGIYDLRPYEDFAKRIHKIKDRLKDILNDLKNQGKTIGAYGAPAKGNTLLNSFEIAGEFITKGVAEKNPVKTGKLTPGSHLPILSEEEFIQSKPDYALLLTWNYLDFFLKESDYIKQGGKFIVPLPEPRIVPEN